MKQKILLTFFVLVSYYPLAAQQTMSETTKLATLGKLYGFLKYYHPEVSQGKFDWDQQLVEYIPKVLKANTKAELSSLYLTWINSLGNIKKCKKCKTKTNYFDKNFDLSWIKNSELFSTELISKLIFIEDNRNQNDNYYVTTAPVGNVVITNETTSEPNGFPSEELRLLGLYKYWNIIEYFYPYKYLTDQDWDSVLEEIIPKIRNSKNDDEYQTTLLELVAKLDDSHAWIVFDTSVKNKFLPVTISHIENKAVIYSYYNESLAKSNNLQLGDIILKINGVPITEEFNRYLKLVSGSNFNFKARKAYEKIFIGPNNTLELTIERDGQVKTINARTYDFKDFDYFKNKAKVKSKSISSEIGYINGMTKFNYKELDSIFDAFNTKKTIIIDLRGYPQFSYKMFTRFVNPEKRIFASKYIPDLSYPGRFIFDESPITGGSKKAFKGQFILLVSNESLSLSEFTAMAFQTNDNIITVGNQTAGADGRNTIIGYFGGYKTAFSGYGIMYPDGTETQRKGIKIDIIVNPTINGLIEGRDEVLEKAIEIAQD